MENENYINPKFVQRKLREYETRRKGFVHQRKKWNQTSDQSSSGPSPDHRLSPKTIDQKSKEDSETPLFLDLFHTLSALYRVLPTSGMNLRLSTDCTYLPTHMEIHLVRDGKSADKNFPENQLGKNLVDENGRDSGCSFCSDSTRTLRTR